MTTRKGTAGGSGRRSAAGKAGARVRRPEPKRKGPNRADAAAAPDPTVSIGYQVAGEPADQKVSDAVAHAVKVGYDVIAENIRQGREAAARFRQGKYSLREAPGEIEVAAQRLLYLARELSTTTFDVCERLIKELAAQKPPEDRAKDLPSFYTPAAAPAAAPAKPATPAPPAGPPAMKVTVRFEGAPKAIAHTTSLARPQSPTAPADVTANPLAPAEGSAKPIGSVRFETDVSVEGIIAKVSVPAGQPPGVYSGLVRAKGDPIPLGVLTVELPK